jgi:hypothetical protein
MTHGRQNRPVFVGPNIHPLRGYPTPEHPEAKPTMFHEGDRVRWSEIGRARLRTMPEAWGVHGAGWRDEAGEVVEVIPPEGDAPLRLSVEFPGGSVWNWDADCFIPIEDQP